MNLIHDAQNKTFIYLNNKGDNTGAWLCQRALKKKYKNFSKRNS